MPKEKIGFIGLGIMGSAMAENLLKAGYPVCVYNRSADKARELVALGASQVNTPAELRPLSDIILMCISNDAAVREVIEGDKGLLEGVKGADLVIDMSTISPSTAKQVAAKLESQGIHFLDAPVSGGDVGAQNATLTIMCGGSPADFACACHIFETLGKKIVNTGPTGTGQLTKAVNQIICALTISAMTEGFLFAEKSGLDLEKTLEIVSSGAAGSWTLDNYAPRVLRQDFKPGFPAEHILKDISIVLAEAEALKLSLPGIELMKHLYSSLCADKTEPLGAHALIQAYREA